jgi:hypothetical protein
MSRLEDLIFRSHSQRIKQQEAVNGSWGRQSVLLSRAINFNPTPSPQTLSSHSKAVIIKSVSNFTQNEPFIPFDFTLWIHEIKSPNLLHHNRECFSYELLRLSLQTEDENELGIKRGKIAFKIPDIVAKIVNLTRFTQGTQTFGWGEPNMFLRSEPFQNPIISIILLALP